MKFINHRLLPSVRAKALLCALTAVILPVLAFAGETPSTVDPNMSVARLYLGSDTAGGAPARVIGTVKLDSNHPESSVVELSVYPADEDWGSSLTPSGILPSAYVADPTDHTLLTFRSNRVMKAGNGQLRVDGNLTLTRVERSVTVNGGAGGEGYFGPAYGDPVLRTVTRKATFIFSSPQAGNQGASSILASAKISHRDFDELSGAIAGTNWPAVVANETCEVPSTLGLGYSGAKCSGTTLGTVSTPNCYVAAGIGEGYTGPVCDAPAGDQTTIVLRLTLTNPKARL